MKKLLITTIVSTLTISVSAFATEYRATNWLQPIHTLNAESYQKFVKNLKAASNGEVNFTVYSGGSIVPAKTTVQALRDGTVQLGIVYPGYTPAELPLGNVLVDLGFLVTDPMAAAYAYTELNLTNKKLIDEWAKQGVIFAGGYSTPIYNFMCAKTIATLADAKGKKIRTAGGTQTEWVSSIGGVPVSVPIGDVYTGLSRGSLDCTMAEVPNLINSKFIEVVKSLTTLDMGAVPGAIYVLNPKFWNELDLKNKKAMVESMARGLADQQIGYANRTREAMNEAKKKIEVIAPSQDLKSALEDFKKKYIKELPEKSMKDRNIADPSDIIKNYMELESKWKTLLEKIDRTNADALTNVILTEIYNKIDINTLGTK